MLRPLRVLRDDAEGLDAEGLFRFDFADDSGGSKKKKKKKPRKKRSKRPPGQLQDPDHSAEPAPAKRYDSDGSEEEEVPIPAASRDKSPQADDGPVELVAEIAELSLESGPAPDSTDQLEASEAFAGPLEGSISSTKKKRNRKKTKEKVGAVPLSNEDDDALLNEAIAQIRRAQADISAAAEIVRIEDPSLRFRSHRDPELSDSEAKMRRFGRGKNLSAIGPPRKRREGGAWLTPPDTRSETSTLLHSSPFTFGFS